MKQMRLTRSRIYKGEFKGNTIRYFINNYDDGSCYGEVWTGFLSVISYRSLNGNPAGGEAHMGVETFTGNSDVELKKRMDDWLEKVLNEKVEMIIDGEK